MFSYKLQLKLFVKVNIVNKNINIFINTKVSKFIFLLILK